MARPPALATARRVAEPAWHRRQRRQRGSARTLLRVAAAADLLGNHHSSQFSMGGRGRQGGGGGGAENGGFNYGGNGGNGPRQWDSDVGQVLRALQQQSQQNQRLLQSLCGGSRGGIGGGIGGQGQHRGGAAGKGNGGDAHRRDLWACQCGFRRNFRDRWYCYQCGLPWSASGGGSSADSRGGGGGGASGARGAASGGGVGAVGGARGGQCGQLASCGVTPGSLRPGGWAQSSTTQQRMPQAAGGGLCPPAVSRPNAGGTSSSAAPQGSGPVGASGNKPVLAWPGKPVAPPSPMADRGVSYAAAVSGGTKPSQSAPQLGGTPEAGKQVENKQPRAKIDEDGFTTVTRRGATKTSDERQGDGMAVDEGKGVLGPCVQADSEERRGGAEGGDRGQDDARTEAPPAVHAHEELQEEERPPSIEELREDWEKKKQTLAWLEKQGRLEDDAVLQAARQQCEAAKETWLARKDPRPLHLRLRWAEEALEKARKNKERMEAQVRELDEDYETKRAALCELLGQARERHKQRLDKVDEIRREIAAGVSPAGNGGGSCSANVSGLKLMQAINNDIGPALAAVTDTLPLGSLAFQQVNALVDRLQVAYREASDEIQRQHDTALYRIAGDDEMDSISELSEIVPWEDDQLSLQAGWPAPAAATAAAAAAHNLQPAPPGGSAAGTPAGQVSDPPSLLPASPTPPSPNKRPGEEDLADGSGKRLAADAEAAEAQRARELLERQAQILQAQSTPGSGGFGGQAAVQMVAEDFHKLVAAVEAQAIAKGIPLEGVNLVQMDPDALKKWAADNGLQL